MARNTLLEVVIGVDSGVRGTAESMVEGRPHSVPNVANQWR